MVNKRVVQTQSEISLVEKGGLVESLWHAVDNAAGNLEYIPGLVRRVIETEAWRRREQDGEIFEHERFIDFITAKPLAGCGWPPDKVEALLKENDDVLALWHKATALPPGTRTDLAYNVRKVRRAWGNSRAYTDARLKRERPDLFERVVSGELSANKAAIQAGFRKKLTPFQQIKRLIPKLNTAEKRELKKLL